MFIKSFILGYMAIGGLMSMLGMVEVEDTAIESKPTVAIEEKAEVKEEVPFEYKNALKKAESYLECSSFSESDLRRQLEHHEFSEEAIRYALENVDVDYQEECIEKAESYLECSSFSESDLRRQLEHHEFNSEHIEKAIQETYK